VPNHHMRGARRSIEAQTGQEVVSPQYFLGRRASEPRLTIGKK
jgi:hypothetical protein